jgi:hypothetical protein
MNAPHYDIAVNINLGTFLTLGTDLFCGEWGTPDAQVLVLDGPAPPSDLPFTYESISIQVLVRGQKSQAARLVYETAKMVYDYLIGLPDNFEANGCGYSSFEPSSNIAPLGKDENDRHIYSMNFSAYRAGV